MRLVPAALLLLLSGTAAAPARADEIFSEVRLGAYVHDLGRREHGADIGAELLFASPVAPGFGDFAPSWLRWVFHPRPDLGVAINTSGYTSQGYVGLTWTAILARGVLGRSDALFAEYEFGPSVNGGSINGDARHDALGSNVLFRLGANLGWRITPRVSLIASFDHESNAGLARRNQGLNNAGLRVGFSF